MAAGEAGGMVAEEEWPQGRLGHRGGVASGRRGLRAGIAIGEVWPLEFEAAAHSIYSIRKQKEMNIAV